MLNNIILSLRPKQWTKNLFIFGALIFTGNIFNISLLVMTIYGFLIFCFLSGGLYIINDILDIEKDKLHPVKKNRPIPAGKINTIFAGIFSIFLIILNFLFSYFLNFNFFIIVILYFILMILYNIWIKNIVVLDVITISLGFVLRVIAGIEIVNVVISPWIILCTALLALLLGFSKRKNEMILYQTVAGSYRAVLEQYSLIFLDQIISIVSASTIVCYCLYTIESETAKLHKNLIFSIPFVIYGIFRYLYLVDHKKKGEEPETILLSDKPLLINLILWIIVCFFALLT